MYYLKHFFNINKRISLFLLASIPLTTLLAKFFIGDYLPGSSSLTLIFISFYVLFSFYYNTLFTNFPKYIIFLSLFLLWLALSILWSPSSEYGLLKFILFIPTGFLIPTSVFIAFRNKSSFVLFMLYSFYVILLFFILALFILNISIFNIHGRLTAASFLGDFIFAPIGLARTFSFFLLVFFICYFIFKPFLIHYMYNLFWTGFFLVPYYFYVLINTGSRGPFFAFLISFLFIIYIKYSRHPLRLLFFVLFLSVFFILPTINNIIFSSAVINRYNEGIEDFRSTSSISIDSLRKTKNRISLLLLALEEGGGFWGTGLGGFHDIYLKRFPYKSSLESKSYPHNIFAEVYCEVGLIGLYLFFIIFSKPLIVFFKYRSVASKEVKVVFILFFWASLNALLSHDLSGNGAFWFWNGASWASINWINDNKYFSFLSSSPTSKFF